MNWATRRGCHVDRAACAWLIRRFIDPAATFVFVDDPDAVPADATKFDMRGADLSHRDGAGCSATSRPEPANPTGTPRRTRCSG